VLEAWQQALTALYPKRLLRGLIQSDGSRHLNKVKSHGRRYEYWRYEFKNRSSDIRAICTTALDRLDVHWTQTNSETIAVSRRDDVAFLDTFIGPKS
jgi:hypothetical protein